MPIAFLTGYGGESLPSEFAGTRVLNKPFMPAQLLATLETTLGHKANTVLRVADIADKAGDLTRRSSRAVF